VLLLVDLDGVVYRGLDPVPGMAALLNQRARAGDRIVYVTNNSRSHREEYRVRLERVGVPLLPTPEQSIVSAARAAAVLLSEAHPPACVAMVLGGPGLARELRDVGIRTVPPTQRGLGAAPDTLVVGVDFRLSYERLSAAADCVRRGARFWATNRDPIFPTETRLMAGAGAIVAAVAYAAGREPDIVIGKPEPRLFEAAAELAGLPVSSAVVIGDSLKTDVAAARRLGARSILMLTGVTTKAELEAAPESARPTCVAADATELGQVLDDLSRG